MDNRTHAAYDRVTCGVGESDTRRAVVAAGLTPEAWEVIEEDEGEGKVVSFLWIAARKPLAG